MKTRKKYGSDLTFKKMGSKKNLNSPTEKTWTERESKRIKNRKKVVIIINYKFVAAKKKLKVESSKNTNNSVYGGVGIGVAIGKNNNKMKGSFIFTFSRARPKCQRSSHHQSSVSQSVSQYVCMCYYYA